MAFFCSLTKERMRKYEPVWLKAKSAINPPPDKSSCEISAHRAYHIRIIKAIVKEKDMDVVFKLECSEMNPPQKALLTSKRIGSVIKFTLTLKPLITEDSV